jgi:hypothetical protein
MVFSVATPGVKTAAQTTSADYETADALVFVTTTTDFIITDAMTAYEHLV